MTVEGVLLAAGGGSRMGMPKALVVDDDGTSWLRRSVTALQDGGCAHVLVVLGARADEARPFLDGLDVDVVVADGWDQGMAASLRTGLGEAAPEHDAAMVSLVDLPDVGAAVVAGARRGCGPTSSPGRLTTGVRGTLCSLGRDHWAAVIETATGDAGATRLPGRAASGAGRVQRPRQREGRRPPRLSAGRRPGPGHQRTTNVRTNAALLVE